MSAISGGGYGRTPRLGARRTPPARWEVTGPILSRSGVRPPARSLVSSAGVAATIRRKLRSKRARHEGAADFAPRGRRGQLWTIALAARVENPEIGRGVPGDRRPTGETHTRSGQTVRFTTGCDSRGGRRERILQEGRALLVLPGTSTSGPNSERRRENTFFWPDLNRRDIGASGYVVTALSVTHATRQDRSGGYGAEECEFC